MLRARLAARLLPNSPAPPESILASAAAVEMVHAASLLHDDVMDGGEIRRETPTFWRSHGLSGAILAGDLLFCVAAELLASVEHGGGLVQRFAEKVREMCEAETEQEILLKGRRLPLGQCIDIARRKTGSLFAFIAGVCGGSQRDLVAALEESGYCVGTAYQIADDLIDVVGKGEVAGKTLGTDVRRRKFTVATVSDEGERIVQEQIPELYASALECLEPWPSARRGLEDFLAGDLQPVLDRYFRHLDFSVRFAL